MTERDPRDVEQALEAYVEATQDSPTPGFTDWVMRSVASEPLPRRGLIAGFAALLTGAGPYRRAAQVALIGLLLVAGIGSAVIVGSSIDLVPGPDVPTPTPAPSVSPMPSPSPEASTTASPSASPSASPTAAPTPVATPDDDADETPDPGETPDSD